jgi:hypothetical protein
MDSRWYDYVLRLIITAGPGSVKGKVILSFVTDNMLFKKVCKSVLLTVFLCRLKKFVLRQL